MPAPTEWKGLVSDHGALLALGVTQGAAGIDSLLRFWARRTHTVACAGRGEAAFPYQTSPMRHSQLIGASRSRIAGLAGVCSTIR